MHWQRPVTTYWQVRESIAVALQHASIWRHRALRCGMVCLAARWARVCVPQCVCVFNKVASKRLLWVELRALF